MDLGSSQIALSEKLGISKPAVSAAVRRGEKIVKTIGYELISA
jgi:predicted DNA binding protein